MKAKRTTPITGETLRAQRERIGKSQKQVSKELGYKTAQFISNYERGRASPPDSKINKLAKVYKLEPKAVIELFVKDFRNQLLTQLTPKKK